EHYPTIMKLVKGEHSASVSLEIGRQILHENLPPDSIDYEKEITLNVVIDGWLLSNILIDT
ncbi:hypothetical protein KI387_007718, partial [Taxus chinensis]